MKEEKKEKNNKKRIAIIIIILVILVLAGGFLYWWFNRKFEITFKYNNGEKDNLISVKYLRKIDSENVEKELTSNGATFVGWFETYYLSGEEIEKIKKDNEYEKEVCQKGFKIDSDKVKCISETEFDFENTQIKKDTIIEALWSTIIFTINPSNKTINVGENFTITASVSGSKDKTVKFTSSDSSIATVNNSGKVVGIKKGNVVITAESNGIKKRCNVTINEIVKETPKVEEPKKEEPKKEEPVVVKDEGTISLKASNKCLIGLNEITITATVSSNAIDKTVNWNNNLKCYNVNNSGNELKISRIGRGTMCRGIEETSPVIEASLNNGNKDSVTLTYEESMTITVYDGERTINPNESDGKYYGNRIKIVSNIDADFTVKNEFSPNANRIQSKDNKSVTITSTSDATVTIKTACGQTKTIDVRALIN